MARIQSECAPSPQIEHLLDLRARVGTRHRARVSTLRTAVVGVGYLGRFHAQKHKAVDGVELVGVCDRDAARSAIVAAEVGTTAYTDHRELLGKVDAVTIAASTAEHFALAQFFLEHGVHVLVEKPMTRTSAEAATLTALADARGLKLQVGHVERFNPALVAARQTLTTVRFIECHRLAPFKGRGADVNVILDLMIHDLDVILSLVQAEPARVSAVGVPVLTDEVDIANARIEFANGAVANVTASRVSTSAQRRFRVFQANQYVSIDFGSGEVRRVTKVGEWREGRPSAAGGNLEPREGRRAAGRDESVRRFDPRRQALRGVRRRRARRAAPRRDDQRRNRALATALAVARYTRPSSPSSLILRVSVLRPQPSSLAASSRLPRARRSAVMINVRSNAGSASASSGGGAATASWRFGPVRRVRWSSRRPAWHSGPRARAANPAPRSRGPRP